MENSNNDTVGQTLWMELQSVVIPQDARWHSDEDVDSTAQSLAKNGQLQEIVVCPLGDGRYEVRAGICRTLAAKKLGWEKIRCNVRPAASDYEKRMITFVENEEREDASPLYQAQLLKAMKDAKGCTQRDLAEEVGKDEATVSQYLSLLDFSPEVQKNFAAAKFSLKQLLEIKKLDGDEAQLKAAQEVQGLTNDQAKAVIKKHMAVQGKAPKTKNSEKDNVGFHFAWKGENLTVRGCWEAKGKGVGTLSMELQTALSQFLDQHPATTEPQAVPEVVPEAIPAAA
jgi:ParB family chromosome partitioning protein